MTGRLIEDQVTHDGGIIACGTLVRLDQSLMLAIKKRIVEPTIGPGVARSDPPELSTVRTNDHWYLGLSPGREGLNDIFWNDLPIHNQIVGIEGGHWGEDSLSGQGAQLIGCRLRQAHGSGELDTQRLRRRPSGSILRKQR